MTTLALPTSDTGVDPPPRAEHVCPVPHIPEGVFAVRRRARAVLSRWALPTGTADDALLVISELITNAIAHARPPAVLRLSLSGSGGRRALLVEVTDAGPVHRPRPSPGPRPAAHAEQAEQAEHGRGTGIVAAVARRHGTSRRPGGITRWAELSPAD